MDMDTDRDMDRDTDTDSATGTNYASFLFAPSFSPALGSGCGSDSGSGSVFGSQSRTGDFGGGRNGWEKNGVCPMSGWQPARNQPTPLLDVKRKQRRPERTSRARIPGKGGRVGVWD